jgi:Na+/phosphate symporter
VAAALRRPDPPPAAGAGGGEQAGLADLPRSGRRETPQVALALATREGLRMADTIEGMLKGLREALQSESRRPITTTRSWTTCWTA